MKYSTQIKQETLALLKILALGSKELEDGKTIAAAEAFRRVRAKRSARDVER